MEFFAELTATSYYHKNRNFFLDGLITEITKNQSDSLQNYKIGDKVSIKFSPANVKEYSWLVENRIGFFKAIRADPKKFPKNGVTHELIVTEARKCVLSLAES